MDAALEGLSESAREALLEVARMLRAGYTGTLELQCAQGGVRDLKQSSTIRFGSVRNQKP
jgi:hypothetical protein